MNLEIVKQEPWIGRNYKGSSKYQPILDVIRALDVGDSVFIDLEEFRNLSGRVKNPSFEKKEMESKYTERVRVLMKSVGKKLERSFVLRRERGMEPWNEPPGVWIFRISQE
jgi:hypothetical protein